MSSTSKEAVLVTLACPHFAVLPATSYRAFTDALAREHFSTAQNLLQKHSEPRRSLDGLWKYSPTVYIATEYHCGRSECDPDPLASTLEMRDILLGLKEFLDNRRSLYLELGMEYFSMLPFLPARALDGRTGLTAHLQFAAETRHWLHDPFFESWKDAVYAIETAMLETGRASLMYSRDALRYLVRGTPDFLRLTNDIWELKELVTLHYDDWNAQEWLFEGRSRHNRFPVERNIALRKQAFVHAARQAYEKRMEGFEGFGVSPVLMPDPELEMRSVEVDERSVDHPRLLVDVNAAEDGVDAMDWCPNR